MTDRTSFFTLTLITKLARTEAMKVAKKISPEDYILAMLSPQERLESAVNVAREAFKDTTLKPADIRAAVQKVRKNVYAERQKKAPSRR